MHHIPFHLSCYSSWSSLACEQNLPVAMHLAESADEIELLNRGGGAFQELLEERSMWDVRAIPRDSRPLDYLRLLAARRVRS